MGACALRVYPSGNAEQIPSTLLLQGLTGKREQNNQPRYTKYLLGDHTKSMKRFFFYACSLYVCVYVCMFTVKFHGTLIFGKFKLYLFPREFDKSYEERIEIA